MTIDLKWRISLKQPFLTGNIANTVMLIMRNIQNLGEEREILEDNGRLEGSDEQKEISKASMEFGRYYKRIEANV